MNPRSMRRSQGWRRSPYRLAAFAAATAMVFVVLIARLVQVQLVHGAEYRAAALANQVRLIPVAAPRGIIYDRHGRVLVRNKPSFTVAAIPSELHDTGAEFVRLGRAIGIAPALLVHRLFHHRGLDYADLAQLIDNEPYGPVILAGDLSVAQVARLSEVLDQLPGIDLEVQPIRAYPYGTLGSHLFGYVGAITEREYHRLERFGYSPNDVVGKDGLEAEYDRYLRGTPGGKRIVVDAAGRAIPGIVLPPKPAIPGDGLVLTIDWRLQTIAEDALAAELRRQDRATGRHLGGAVVIENPWNGAVLALVSQPNFDPNAFATGISARLYDSYLNDPAHPLFDRAIDAATPTGSTFKLVTGTAAISEGIITPNERIYDKGAWNCFGRVFRDLVSGGLGWTTFPEALAASEDGYFYHISALLGNERLRKWALLFGLGSPSGIDLPGEFGGLWPTNAWMERVAGVPLEPADVCSLGIGQGAMEATPVQMADVVSVVVNGGTLYRPQIVREIVSPDGRVITRFHPEVIRRVPGTPQAFAAVRKGMEMVTSAIGTAYGLAIPGLPYGGKTGTAETAGGAGPNTTWFVAFAPVRHPTIAMAVYVERSGGYGATVAAPVAREIMMRYFRVGKPTPSPPSQR
jgi:penicillin-binding protein 2